MHLSKTCYFSNFISSSSLGTSATNLSAVPQIQQDFKKAFKRAVSYTWITSPPVTCEELFLAFFRPQRLSLTPHSLTPLPRLIFCLSFHHLIIYCPFSH